MKTVIVLAITFISTGCATGQPHPASAQMQPIQGKTVTSWVITPRENDAQLDIYVDGGNAPAATLFLTP